MFNLKKNLKNPKEIIQKVNKNNTLSSNGIKNGEPISLYKTYQNLTDYQIKRNLTNSYDDANLNEFVNTSKDSDYKKFKQELRLRELSSTLSNQTKIDNILSIMYFI